MSDIIKTIKKDIKSKVGKYVARDYYFYKPKKIIKEINTYSSGEVHTFKTGDGCYLYTNYFKMLVKQKINYMLAKEPELKVENSIITNTQVVDMLEEGLFNASLDTATWLHFYVNEDNKLDWIFVTDSEIIPLYDKYKKNIIGIIRYYLIDEDTYHVETWSKNGVKIETIEKDKIQDSQYNYHYNLEKEYNGEVEEIKGQNFNFIPFIPFFNNKDKESDLNGIQDLIDMYNSISSGLVDNIDLFQEAIVKLKGFTSDPKELEQIQKDMRKYKMVSIQNPDGDMDYMGIEIPIEARKVILEILKENIFKIGNGLDPDRLAGESNITNVVIKSRYASLDMKGNGTQKQIKLFYEPFIQCLNDFYGTSMSNEITLDRSMIFNTSEEIDNCLKSMNLLDLETVLENHPWVKNVKKTLAAIQKEQQEKEEQNLKRMELETKIANNMTGSDL